ncbi:MAG TPA: hypothetical protein VN700_18145 [Vicinamibacterales bacterium]|nr:hypothetical protein [Vicinamibacterales bacterium]
MGRPYDSELSELSETYSWANTIDLPSALVRFPETTSPLLAIGSGGSLTVAEFAASMHREIRKKVAIAATPLEVLKTQLNLRDVAVLLTSAGGRHPDVLGTVEQTAIRDPRSFLVLCLRRESPLADRARRFANVDFLDFKPPVERDGFLATNSLLALVVMLARAYEGTSRQRTDLPPKWTDLVPAKAIRALNKRMTQTGTGNTLVVLYGPSTRVAAVDLESRFTEAALQNVWIADYRNFAHGRHHWLAKHPKSTSVLAFVTPEDDRLASATLALIPRSVPVVREDIPFSGSVATIAALGRVIHLTGGVGTKRNIDPGRPGVPSFGRRLYHLNAFGRRSVRPPDLVAIERKTGKSVDRLSADGLLSYWREAHDSFRRTLLKSHFKGVVFDYDGTLCGETDRFGELQPAIAAELVRLLQRGVLIGIATGRGKSVREALRRTIPAQHWPGVVVGYYNGGDVGLLSDARPDGSPTAGATLAPIATVLKANTALRHLATIATRLPQITIEPLRPIDTEDVWTIVEHTVATLGIPGTSAVRSSHSIDVLGPAVDKRAVLQRLHELRDDKDSGLLCIGDKGRYPGNDYLLLAQRPSLSVDECSIDPSTCWNLASAGSRRVTACLQYLRAMKTGRQGMQISTLPNRIGSERPSR